LFTNENDFVSDPLWFPYVHLRGLRKNNRNFMVIEIGYPYFVMAKDRIAKFQQE
jgi:hypothetical protein